MENQHFVAEEIFDAYQARLKGLTGSYPERMWFPQELCDLDVAILKNAQDADGEEMIRNLHLMVSVGQTYLTDEEALTPLLKLYTSGIVMDIWRGMITKGLFDLSQLPDIIALLHTIYRAPTSEDLKDNIEWFVDKVLLIVNNQYLSPTIHPQVAESIRYIHDHISDPRLNATFIAAQVGFSPNYLSQLFLRDMNFTLAEYIRNQRIIHAHYLLTTTRIPMSEIAKKCGFKSASQFTKTYSQSVGHTPTRTRRKHHEAELRANAKIKAEASEAVADIVDEVPLV